MLIASPLLQEFFSPGTLREHTCRLEDSPPRQPDAGEGDSKAGAGRSHEAGNGVRPAVGNRSKPIMVVHKKRKLTLAESIGDGRTLASKSTRGEADALANATAGPVASGGLIAGLVNYGSDNSSD